MIVQKTESGTFEPVGDNITISAAIAAELPDDTLAQLALYRVEEPVIPAGKREIGPRTYVMQDGKVIAVLLLGDIPSPPAPAVLDYGDLWVTDPAFAGGAKRSKQADITDDSWPAFDAAKQAIIADRVNDGGRNLRVPHGFFYLSQPFEMNEAGFNLIGSGGGMAGGNGTVLRWPAGSHGVIVGRHNTSGLAPADSHGIGGDGSRIEDMLLWSHGQGTDTPHNGITLLARALLRNVYTAAWPQHGMQVTAPIAGGVGNANCFRIEGGRSAYNGLDGLNVMGSDANAGLVYGLDVAFNGRWGIFAEEFLSGTFVGCHAEANGMLGNGTTKFPSYVYHQGSLWLCRVTEDARASVTEPGTNIYVWLYAGGAEGPRWNAPQWEPGIRVQAGGPYASYNANARNVFIGCYSEGGQPPSQVQPPAYILEGIHAAGISVFTRAMLAGQAEGGWRVTRQDGLTVDFCIDPNLDELMKFNHPTKVQHVNRMVINEDGDIAWTLDNSGSVYRIIQPGSRLKFGRSGGVYGGFYPSQLFISDSKGEGRQVDYGYGPPEAPRESAKGDFRFNLAPSPGADLGWACIGDGTPGVWASAGKIAAQ